MALHAHGESLTDIADQMSITVKRANALIKTGISALPNSTSEDILVLAQLRFDAAATLAGRLMSHEDPRVALAAARDLANIEATRARVTGSWLKPEVA
jgi:hypothetical protein